MNTKFDPIYVAFIHHDGSRRYVLAPDRDNLQVGDELLIRLRTGLNAPIQKIFFRTCPDGEQLLAQMEKEPASDESACQWWSTHFRISMPVTNYRFLLFTEDGTWWFNGSGSHRHNPTDTEDFKILAGYTSPAWVRESVFYQIFPDRFADGDPASNVRSGEYTYHGQTSIARSWGEPQSGWPEAMVEFYGGDLQGIEQQLDYLSDLGVNALYLNPIFTALSNHRYDVIDYYNVDPHLGGNLALMNLRRATEKHGMRIIVDIVPNHCGWEHEWFKSAQRDPSAPTAGYFTFHRHPDEYECWLGVQSLPKLNYRNRQLREVIYSSADSVFRHWLKEPYLLDGWRVDVANMLARHGKDQVEREVWEGIRQAVKEENPHAYLLGENFFDGSSQLQGDQLDATMNYAGFTKPVVYWLNKFYISQHSEPHQVESAAPWPTEALVASWQASRATIPWTIACQQFNLLDSHDTARIFNRVAEKPARLRLAVALLLTYVGVPCIYYGDEVGMRGGDSHAARDCMIWDYTLWDEDLRTFFKTLIQLRRKTPALIEGGFQVLLVEEDALAYLRDTEQSRIILVGNRSNQDRPAGNLLVAHGAVPNGLVFKEIFSGQTSVVRNGYLPLPPVAPGAQVWLAQQQD